MWRFSLRADGIEAVIITYGAAVTALRVPDRAGRLANVVLGLPDVLSYEARSPHFGAIAGRYANRIARGRFTLDGQPYQLTRNAGPHSLHGGAAGFGNRVWTVGHSGPDCLKLTLTSPDGEEGYPGTLCATVTYTIEPGALRIAYAATTDRPTVLNLTNHSYFNLAGEGQGDVMGHVVQLDAGHYLPVDSTMIPTGDIHSVQDTAFDFRTPRPIGAAIRSGDPQLVRAQGYDHCWVLPGAVTDELRRAAQVTDPGSGRVLEVLTTEPGVQFYTGNQMTGTLVGPSGRAYRQGDGFCLETQHFPDSPNVPTFPSTTLRPGNAFRSVTVFRFSSHQKMIHGQRRKQREQV